MAALLLVALVATGCADEIGDIAEPTEVAPRAEVVEFETSDGVKLSGFLFGSGDTAVVLGHMRGSGKEAWTDVAVSLSKNGMMAFACDFRGYAGQPGKRDTNVVRDMAAAVQAVRDQGAKKVIVAGASMGATAAVAVAAQEQVDGVVAVSPPTQFSDAAAMAAASQLDVPALFIAAIDDQPDASDAAALAEAADGRFASYPGKAHGTDLFTEHGAAPTALIIRFAKNPAAEEQAG